MDMQVDPNEPTVLLLFYQGLPQRLAEKCIELDSPNDFTSWTKAAQRNQCNWILTQALRRKGGKASNTPRPGNPPPGTSIPLEQQRTGTTGRRGPTGKAKTAPCRPRRDGHQHHTKSHNGRRETKALTRRKMLQVLPAGAPCSKLSAKEE
jgi:hypothetical protein